jgi:hypothetical protein
MTNIDGAGRVSPDNYAARGHESARRIAHRLVHDGEIVVDVPSKLSAQVRVFATGQRPQDGHCGRTLGPRWSPCARMAWSGSWPVMTW